MPRKQKQQEQKEQPVADVDMACDSPKEAEAPKSPTVYEIPAQQAHEPAKEEVSRRGDNVQLRLWREATKEVLGKIMLVRGLIRGEDGEFTVNPDYVKVQKEYEKKLEAAGFKPKSK